MTETVEVQRQSPSPPPHAGALGSAVVAFAVVLVVLLAWMPRVMERLNPLTGDEPFYVMTSFSILDDYDLDETNNYAQRDFDRFYPAFGPARSGWSSYPDPLPPHASHTKRAGLYTKHGLGIPLIVALPWKIGGRTLTLVVLAVLAAFVSANMAMLAHRFGATPLLSMFIALLLSLTSPLMTHSLLIFPEILSALCIVYAVRRLLERENENWQWLLTGCGVAFLPWLHYRLATISIVLGIAALRQLGQAYDKKGPPLFIGPPVVSALIMFAWYNRLYGSFRPPASDHAGFSDLAGTINGLAGTFLDQQWGAIIHNPLIALAIVASVPFALAHRRDSFLLAAVAVPYLLLISAYRVWWGEWNPPGRYLTDVVPLAAAPLGYWLSTLSLRAARGITVVAALPALAVSATFLHDPRLMYNQPDGTSSLLETWSDWVGRDLTGLIPSFVFYSESPGTDRIVFGGGVALLIYAASEVALRHGGRNQ